MVRTTELPVPSCSVAPLETADRCLKPSFTLLKTKRCCTEPPLVLSFNPDPQLWRDGDSALLARESPGVDAKTASYVW